MFHPSLPICRNHETFCRYPTNMHTVSVLHAAAGRAFQPFSCIEPPLGLALIFRVFFPLFLWHFWRWHFFFRLVGCFFLEGLTRFSHFLSWRKCEFVLFPTWSFIVFLEALKNGCSGYQVPMKMFHHGRKETQNAPTNLRVDEKLKKVGSLQWPHW